MERSVTEGSEGVAGGGRGRGREEVGMKKSLVRGSGREEELVHCGTGMYVKWCIIVCWAARLTALLLLG